MARAYTNLSKMAQPVLSRPARSPQEEHVTSGLEDWLTIRKAPASGGVLTGLFTMGASRRSWQP